MVAIFAAVAVQSALIIALFYEDRRRRRSEANAQVLMGGARPYESDCHRGPTHRLDRSRNQTAVGFNRQLRQRRSELAEASTAQLDEVRSGLENIINQVHRVDDVIKSVNALFKNESPRREPRSISTRLFDRFLLPRHGRWLPTELCWKRISSTTHPPIVMANPGQLQQVILNLITNAIEAMSASEHGARTLRIETSIDQADSVVITVADSGPGFDSKVAEQLFKPFFTTKSSGMGLGLPICKSIIEAHNGQLTVASREPRGAVFRIVLPRARHE